MRLEPLVAVAFLVAAVACTKQDQVKNDVAPTGADVGAPPPSASTSTPPTSSSSGGTAPTAAVAARSCPVAPPDNGQVPAHMIVSTPECHKDADCTAGRQGRCVFSGGGHAAPRVACTYDACASDGDCKGELCLCGSGGSSRNQCIPANCHDDADCALHAHCSDSSWGTRGTSGRFCHTPADKCKERSDCKDGETCGYVGASSRWECMPEIPRPVG